MLITLSRQLGSEGDVIAARVAVALGLLLVDREYIRGAALAAGVPAELLQKLMYEGRRSLAGEILDSLLGAPAEAPGKLAPASPLGGVFTPLMPPTGINLEEAVQTIGLVIKDVASRGNVLVLGQGGQVWLRDYQGACHVKVVAPLESRVARVAERERLSAVVARRKVRASDAARNEYLARYHNINWLDPLHYHLVINTGQTSIEAAVSLIVHAAQVVGRGL
ncbi:MAG: hypothetical protein CVU38_08980 [Chloroflexi bacterium HGW-Chloroflexi-1]|nr:MAG: hypothetical protein CVU38_08980 [Chloroflexi bacterium HGW-Chloroflexi-1]